MKLPNKKLILILLAIPLLFFANKAHAQAVRIFTIVPPSIEANLNPGGHAEGTMKVINDSAGTLYFTANIQDFIVNDPNGTPTILPAETLSNKYSAASWIEVTPSTFAVPAHSQQVLNYYIQIPANAGAGGHYAAITYQPASTGILQGSGTTVNTVLGTLFYIGVNGNITQGAKVTQFTANSFQEYGPVNILTQIQNNGDLHIKPVGGINVFDILGRKVETVGLAQHNVFPGGIVRDYQNQVGGKLMIGRYKANLLASYGTNNNLPLAATVYFWVFPWRATAVIILIVIAIILGSVYYRRRKKMGSDHSAHTSTHPEDKSKDTTTPPQAPKTV